MKSKRRERIVGVVAFAAAVFAATSCGVPEDATVRPLDDSEIAFRLTATTTSTSTSTAPPTTVPATTTSTLPVPTTSPPPTTIAQTISLYFVNGDRLVRVVRQSNGPVTANDLITILALGPSAIDGHPFARTAIEFGDVEGVELSGGIASVDLGPRFLDLPSAERRRAVSQIVLTLASQTLGIGPVRFRRSGQIISVPRGDGSIGGRTVSREDYIELVDDPLAPTSTIATTPTPSDI